MKAWKRRCWALSACLFPVALAASDQVSTWNGGSGNWNVGSSWTTSPTDGLVPNNGNAGFTFDAIVGGGTVNLDIDVTLNGLTLTGAATIEGTGNLSVLQNVDWHYGFLNGTGIASFHGTTVFSGSSGADRTINNFGTFTGAGGLDGTGIINNQSGGVLHYHSGNIMYFDGTGELNNLAGGTITVDNAIVSVGRSFHNAGQVNVQAGGFTIGGGGTNTGTITVATGQTLVISGESLFTHHGTITGGGDVEFVMGAAGEAIIASGSTFTPTGTVRLLGGTTTLNVGVTLQHLQFSGHELRGSSIPTVADTFQWTNGTITSGLTLQGTSTLTGGTLNGTINNHGVTSTVDGGGFQGEGGGIWNNKSGSSFTFVGGGGTGGIGTFNNEAGAVLTKTGAAIAGIAWELNNTGQLNVQGDLLLHGQTTNSGSINLSSGATLFVNSAGGTNAFTSTGTITGPGNIDISPNDVATIEAGSTFTPSGLVSVRSGEVRFNTVVSIPLLNLEFPATLAMNNTMAVTDHANINGFINGTGTLNLTGTASQVGSLVVENGTVNVQNTMTIAPNSGLAVGAAAVFNNHGTLEVHGQSWVALSGTFDNKAGATLVKRDADLFQIYEGSGGPRLFNNAGMFRAEAGTTTFGSNEMYVVNQPTGLIHAQGGDITFFGTAAVNNLGEMRVDAGRTIQVAAPMTNSGHMSGAGTILGPQQIHNATFAGVGGTLTVGGTGDQLIMTGTNNRVTSGSVQFNGLEVQGSISVQPGASLSVQSMQLRGGTLTGNINSGLVDNLADSTLSNGSYTFNNLNVVDGNLTVASDAAVTVSDTVHVSSSVELNGMVTSDTLFTADTGRVEIKANSFWEGRQWRIEGNVFISQGGRGKTTLPATVFGTINIGGEFEGDIVTVPDANHPGVVSGSGTIEGSAQVGVLGGIDVGSSPGTLTITNGVTLLEHSFLNMEIGYSLTDLLRITGGVFSVPDGNIHVHITPLEGLNEGDVFTLIDWTGATTNSVTVDDFLLGSNSTVDGTFSIVGSQLLFTVSSVPEPTTWALMGVGLAGSGLVYWRKRRQWRAFQESSL